MASFWKIYLGLLGLFLSALVLVGVLSWAAIALGETFGFGELEAVVLAMTPAVMALFALAAQQMARESD